MPTKEMATRQSCLLGIIMFYVADEKEKRKYTWKEWLWVIIALLTLGFALFSFIYGPPVNPPDSMNSSEPYWYSGE